MAELPKHVAEIDASWLENCLRAGSVIDPSTAVVGVTCEPVAAGVGFMGEVARLRPEYSGGSGPGVVIAKIPTQDENVRALLAAARVFEREARFYMELAAQLDAVPNAYHVAADFDSDDYVLLLEDLGHLRTGDQLVGATVDDARAALRGLAALHAEFWRSPRLDALTWLPRIDDPGMKIGREIYAASLPRFLDVFGSILDPRVAPVVDRFGANVHQLMDRFAAMPTTVVHFDYRLDNLFFDDGSPAGDAGVSIIDFQASCKGGGAYDVGYFMSQNLPIDVRRAHEDELLRAYHDALTAGGVADYSFAQLRDDYRVGVLYGWIIPVYAVGTLDSSSDRAVALWSEVIRRSQSAMLDHDVESLLID
jgi:aminoglycoside/choline kinase family phosphotransferase